MHMRVRGGTGFGWGNVIQVSAFAGMTEGAALRQAQGERGALGVF